ncbi:hypothetical protein OG921_07595 [Aldersonia sp. NBC_00410]|uniref:hypothetical protein n=1 Tax=Aldersonia sp. NBC_00410 TaxID=2975954 RepID=UPI00224CB26F|nr:hypothetical protein [Aldersonia sp. NBC_00410]MCX5043031.1 hypothetical protein [Aldersonia sp. NBC_00410]
MPEFAELERLIGAVRRSGAQRVADALTAVLTRWRSPVQVRVLGRSGVGKTTAVAALGLPDEGENTADLTVYLVLAPVRPADETALAGLPARSTLLVVNKVDALDADPQEYCATLAAKTGLDTVGMIASLAVAVQHPFDRNEVAAFRGLAGSGDPTLTLSSELFRTADVPVPAKARQALLDRWPLAAIRAALDALAANSDLDEHGLHDLLRRASGIDGVTAALTELADRARDVRGGRVLDEIERIGARATPEFPLAGAEVERFLDGPVAARIGLAAGLAESAGSAPDPDPAVRRAAQRIVRGRKALAGECR